MDASTDVRCSTWARTVGLDPIGTAGAYGGYLLVELPLPWPKDVAEQADVAALRGEIDPRIRIQALVPTGERRRVIAYLRPPSETNGFCGFVQSEAEVAGSVKDAAVALLGGRALPAEAEERTRDLLLCTHGRRDICCGSLGMELYLQMRDLGLPPNVGLWRTSHTGGHRFAPTFIVLPEGTTWAYADAALVRQVLLREGDASKAADRYRGCSGLGSPLIQAVEREVLRRVGWRLLDLPRYGTAQGGRVTLRVREGEHVATWEASVEPGRAMPLPDCRAGVADTSKRETEWTVTRLTMVGATSLPRQ